jgi:hypothetical protein
VRSEAEAWGLLEGELNQVDWEAVRAFFSAFPLLFDQMALKFEVI